jgi:tight adherence protein B
VAGRVSGPPPLPLAAAAGALAGLAAVELAAAAVPSLRARLPRAVRQASALTSTLRHAGSEGREPGSAERRRLLVGGSALALIGGTFVAGPLAGVVAGGCAPWLLARLVRARRERHRGAVEAGVPAVALAVADALSGGHSLRGALSEAARSVGGAAGSELRRVASELELGAPTEQALEALRQRARSHGVDVLVAAMLLQRSAGGDLARLLRESASAFEDQARLQGEVRAATAQARFTGFVVVLLPVGGALLAELASPGYLRGLAGSFLTLWLVGIATAMQIVAAVAIRRLARTRE